MLVEFVNENTLEASVANVPPVVNPGKPFELDDRAAAAYINEGVLKPATAKAKAQAPAQTDKTTDKSE